MDYIRRILLVEDESNYANTLIRHLRREFIVDLVQDAQGSIAKIEDACSRKTPFDLVIMNTRIHTNNVIGLMEWIHQNHHEVSVILISIYGHSDEVIEKIRPAMDDYGNKPLTPQQMMELIDSVERKRKCAHVRTRKRMEKLKAELSNAHPVVEES